MSSEKIGHEGKKHKPSSAHPWRQPRTTIIDKWAKEMSETPKVNNYLKGGGKKV